MQSVRHWARERKTQEALLNRIISLPDAPGERWFSADLLQKGRAELELERGQLILRLTIEGDESNWWFQDRLRSINEELAQRV